MADTEILKRAEKYIKGKGQTLNKYDLVGFAEAENANNRIAELEKENAELKADNDARKFAMAMSGKVEKQLREKNAELKRDNEGYEKDNTSLVNQFNQTSAQLIKAKEIIRELMNWYWETDICADTMPQELRQKAEQFISEVEK